VKSIQGKQIKKWHFYSSLIYFLQMRQQNIALATKFIVLSDPAGINENDVGNDGSKMRRKIGRFTRKR
jgi:hypothetical protein